MLGVGGAYIRYELLVGGNEDSMDPEQDGPLVELEDVPLIITRRTAAARRAGLPQPSDVDGVTVTPGISHHRRPTT
ncbi:hypothetical protein CRUP_001622 [Coryphaenoides rupestris]|nr:hypothetical protein CRUP_001622 [Coryphaenoides rupestris]